VIFEKHPATCSCYGACSASRKELNMSERRQIDQALVGDFVRNAHGDLKRVQELLEQEPGLVNAAMDWGNGDWETGLGAASHVGNRPIAMHLLERGARMDIFAAAMLGEVEIVRAFLAAVPSMREFPGPHGISLLSHARAGGAAAAGVVELLEGQVSST
jgi:hypothetical protein